MENYRATLAHKINHNFHYNCTEWFFQHPRHGLIPSIIATSDLKQGQELYLHYGNEWINSGLTRTYILFLPRLRPKKLSRLVQRRAGQFHGWKPWPWIGGGCRSQEIGKYLVFFIFKFAFPGKFLQNNRNVRNLLLLPGFDKLTNLQLIFCYSLQLNFLSIL